MFEYPQCQSQDPGFLQWYQGTSNEDILMILTQPPGSLFPEDTAILLVKSNYQQKNRNLSLV